MRIHTVRKPFMSREGQFEEGEQSLCIGLDIQALQSTNTYRCYIGKNKKVYYEIDIAEALRYAKEHTIWENDDGRKVAILPLFLFDKKKSQWDKEEYEEKELARGKHEEEIRRKQPSLF